MKKIILFAAITLSVAACKKDPVEPTPTPTPTPAATTGSLKIEFEPMVGDSELVFNTQYYKNANNDSFTVSIFRYYVSNIVLTKSDNSTYAVPNSYFKIDHNTSGANIASMSGIPVGNYKSVQFMIGVDSARNVSGAQEGALAVSDMFWTWSSGYIHAKFEGTSPKSPATGHNLLFHVGGYYGANKGQRTVNISFGSSTANVSGSVTPQVHLSSDILKWFDGAGGIIDFSVIHTVHMPGANSVKIANNFAAMFTLEHVHN